MLLIKYKKSEDYQRDPGGLTNLKLGITDMSVLSAWVAFGAQRDQQLPEGSLGNRDTLLFHSVV